MATVVIVIHLMVVLALIAVVLLQRSEGGALGIGGGGGGGGGMGGLLTGRGTANVLTRTTAVLAVMFFATSITLTILARNEAGPSSILDRPAAGDAGTVPSAPSGSGSGILDQLPPAGGACGVSGPQVPSGDQ